MSLEYYYVLSLLNSPPWRFYSDDSQKTEQEVRKALGLNYADFKPDNSGCGKFPYVYDAFAIWNISTSNPNP